MMLVSLMLWKPQLMWVMHVLLLSLLGRTPVPIETMLMPKWTNYSKHELLKRLLPHGTVIWSLYVNEKLVSYVLPLIYVDLTLSVIMIGIPCHVYLTVWTVCPIRYGSAVWILASCIIRCLLHPSHVMSLLSALVVDSTGSREFLRGTAIRLWYSRLR